MRFIVTLFDFEERRFHQMFSDEEKLGKVIGDFVEDINTKYGLDITPSFMKELKTELMADDERDKPVTERYHEALGAVEFALHINEVKGS